MISWSWSLTYFWQKLAVAVIFTKCIFVTRSSIGYQHFYLMTDLFLLLFFFFGGGLLLKNFNTDHFFWTVVVRAFISIAFLRFHLRKIQGYIGICLSVYLGKKLTLAITYIEQFIYDSSQKERKFGSVLKVML